MYEQLTWAQIYLLLDGAAYNAPEYEAGNGGENTPAKPDEKTSPIEALRWDLKHKWTSLSEAEIECECQRFQDDIDAGRRVWSELDKKWVAPNA